jgi:hypothetical protein
MNFNSCKRGGAFLKAPSLDRRPAAKTMLSRPQSRAGKQGFFRGPNILAGSMAGEKGPSSVT